MIDSTRKRREQAQKDRVRRRINTKIDPENYEFRPAKKQVDYYDNEVEQRVAVYARVSTGNVQQTTSYELQKKYYEDFVIHHPNWTLVKIYADVDAPYGQNTKRPLAADLRLSTGVFRFEQSSRSLLRLFKRSKHFSDYFSNIVYRDFCPVL